MESFKRMVHMLLTVDTSDVGNTTRKDSACITIPICTFHTNTTRLGFVDGIF